jgi:hypothetical protein
MAQIDHAEIEKRFAHVEPNEQRASLHTHTRSEYTRLAETMARTLPESREKSLAITALEESLMWANAAIARNVKESS